ncbi:MULTISPECIES: hypothetical protein [Methylobacterium]|uniref:Uncharacterized protein n=1 Tax=Methylobacterium jeotgali TaxID=381630 RepID=A0ABQ4SXK0_9HYPH|nr:MULTISPECIES: hypothetical protein [Methylobacterium]PIU07525.1 MAG: hypothetical protein COT56_04705 [Methylobacterium sp. CG09_land_8_20_14_0_10_71_15]PIU13312.1 MAG: hypothetical protein COT28_11845 [Methylobacterium sp. CG08_land_8_20_14_0_20_71_15]GBU17776.1 hypothetical protein AwMethylo_19910 [Methylobacterium sp.]GJE06396.1 hypothetical protein AOPFMNJM_1712 [Methylobacterium jeotgali]
MSDALEAYRALPAPYRRVALSLLRHARRWRKDRWPTLQPIDKAARRASLRVDCLAAMFGFVALPYGLKDAIVFRDTMRGGDVSPDHVYDSRLRPFYEFFRAAVAADDEPMDKRRPRYSDELGPPSG